MNKHRMDDLTEFLSYIFLFSLISLQKGVRLLSDVNNSSHMVMKIK